METFLRIFEIIRKVSGGLVIYLLLLISLPIFPQTVDNIELPSGDGGGSMAFDIITANGYIFVYTADGIQIYSQSTNNHEQTILFDEDIFYGKYNPVYYNDRMHFGAASLMALNENQNILYVLFPNLMIKGISTINPFSEVNSFNSLQEPPGGLQGLLGYFAPLHHACILKYDHVHNRLYWVIYGRSPNMSIGNFHSASRYFAIFDVDELDSSLSYYYTELRDDSNDYYDKNISDIVFNTSVSSPQNNFYYLTKLNKIEVWEIIGNNQVVNRATVDVDNSIYGYFQTPPYEPKYYKFSKMIYVNNSNIHQIIALPYRYPSSELQEGKVPLVYILDGSWDGTGDITYNTITAPSEKVSDGLLIQNTYDGNVVDDLILSYAQDPDEYLNWPGTDIAIFRHDNFSQNYIPHQQINTDISVNISEYDINTAFKLFPLYINNVNNLIIGKKDEISKIAYNGYNGLYELQPPILEAESNYIRSGVTSANKHYLVNSVSNGLEVLTNGEHSQSIASGYPVYNIEGNYDGSKLYFFNTLQSENTGLYIYNQSSGQSVNINSDGNPGNDIEKAIGDCVYNPFKNHFLISEYGDFGGSPAIVRVIDGGSGNAHVQDIELTYNNLDAQYPKEMFISPDGKLYVMVNMHRDNQLFPKVFEFNAYDNGTVPAYSLLNSYDVGMPEYIDEYDGYSAHFCYNSFNQTVYLTVHPTELALDPYNTLVNSMFDILPPTDNLTNNGKLIGIKDGQMTRDEVLFYPGKVICPGTEHPQIPTDFDGNMFIIGKQFYRFNPDLNNAVPISTESFNDITYSPYHDKMFAIKDISFSINSPDHRICEVYSIESVDGVINYTNLISIPGQFSSITYNPYDNKVYLYRKLDEERLGDTPVQIIWFDPEADPFVVLSEDCLFRGIHPGFNHSPDHHYYFYNITEPYIDPVNNYIYFPNGGHSSVSRMSFTPDEPVPLDVSLLTWLSFPRLIRYGQNPTVDEVLGGDNINPSNYEANYSYLQSLPPGFQNPVTSIYTGTYWPSVTFLSEIDSRYGYKLHLDYDAANLPEKEWLHTFGNVLLATTPLNVYRQYENWLGYWLYESQSPFDAFPSEVMDQLRSIIHQNWTCAKYGSSPDGQQPPYYWLCACHKGKVQLQYGDMVIAKTDEGIGSFTFQWQRYGNPILDEERPDTEFYTYTEQTEYTPYLVELDTTDLPAEIGAFVNDTCVGATTVLEGDTLVLVPGYIEGMNGEVTFELYHDSLKSSPHSISKYFVENPKTRRKERRTIHTMERQDFFLISFTKEQEDAYFLSERPISINPNPSKGRFTLGFTLPENGETVIDIYDLFGRKVHAFSEGYLPAGFHWLGVNLSDVSGETISEGLYLINVLCGQYRSQAKLMVIH